MIDEAALREAGQIAAAARSHAAGLATPGARLSDICASVESEIRRMGGQAAFPVQTSRNEVAAHFCPRQDDPTTCSMGDLLKIDLGVHIDGWVVDTAVTVAIEASPTAQSLVSAVRAALDAAVARAGPLVPISHLSATIDAEVTSRGFRPIRNLCGHHLGRWTVHCPPPIPNFADGSCSILLPGAIFAIEPFATTGAGVAAERGNAEVFRVRAGATDLGGIDWRLRDLLIARNGLPFSRRDLAALPGAVVQEGMAHLLATNAIAAYPPLVEMSGHPVAQAEHTLLVRDGDVLVLTA